MDVPGRLWSCRMLTLFGIVLVLLTSFIIFGTHKESMDSYIIPAPPVSSQLNTVIPGHAEDTALWRTELVNGEQYMFPSDIIIRTTSQIKLDANMSEIELLRKYEQALQTIEVECRHSARLGPVTDGGWDACIAPPYTLQPPCLVYDFGIAEKWGFPDAIDENYGCQIRAFDPTNGLKEHNRSRNIRFYPIGLHGSNGILSLGSSPNSSVKTLGTIMKDLDEEGKVIDYLKIDIEGSEWPALETIFVDGILPRHVKQIGIEFHSGNTRRTFEEGLKTFNKLHSLGFRKWKDDLNRYTLRHDKRFNQVIPYCHEVYFININFMKIAG